MFRGLRVRMGVHSGLKSEADVQLNRTANRMQYTGTWGCSTGHFAVSRSRTPAQVVPHGLVGAANTGVRLAGAGYGTPYIAFGCTE